MDLEAVLEGMERTQVELLEGITPADVDWCEAWLHSQDGDSCLEILQRAFQRARWYRRRLPAEDNGPLPSREETLARIYAFHDVCEGIAFAGNIRDSNLHRARTPADVIEATLKFNAAQPEWTMRYPLGNVFETARNHMARLREGH